MNVLALNPGSSSLKFGLYRFPPSPDTAPRAETIERVTSGAMGEATTEALRRVRREPIDSVGCRVVHGGSRFIDPAIVDDSVIEALRGLAELAPLHNAPAVAVLEEVRLGSGASLCAIRDGRSVDTSMGFTPMEGLVMGTRAGELDPGAILFLLRGGMSEDALDDLLNQRCGLLGEGGESRAELALQIFAYRAARYIGAYTAVLGGLDAIAFAAGIGEHSASMRQRICHRLSFLGIEFGRATQSSASTGERRISSGRVEVWVIPTNEELEIARLTHMKLFAVREPA